MIAKQHIIIHNKFVEFIYNFLYQCIFFTLNRLNDKYNKKNNQLNSYKANNFFLLVLVCLIIILNDEIII